MIDVWRENLLSYDVCITQDFYIDSLITYREAVRNCGVKIPFIHFCRSGIGTPLDFSMANALYVYLNKTDVGRFAQKINVPVDKCRTVFNEKEPAYMFGWHPITRIIVNKYQLWNRDIIQTYPMCTTRMSAKGLDSVIKTFIELKRLGKKVALIIANSNGRKRVDDIKAKIAWAKEIGLNEDELIFTSLLNDEMADNSCCTASEVPNKVCAELMSISNLFIFPTISEVSSNVELESSMTKQLLVINEDLPSLMDFCDPDSVLTYPFTSLHNMHYTGRDEDSLAKLARQIVGQIDSNKADKQFRHVWRNNNSHKIYKVLESILEESVNK